MLIFLALLGPLAAQVEVRIEGLRPGEYATLLEPSVASADSWSTGRLLDGSTLAPITGACLDATSEGSDTPFVLVGSARTDSSGRFRLRLRRAGYEAEKVRLRAAGYRSTTWPAGELWVEDRDYLLAPAGPPARVRILDLDDRPVAGAWLEEHQSCSHDPPAVEGVSDEQGWIEIPDLTPWEEIGEFRLLAPGYGSLVWLEMENLAPAPGYEDVVTIRLPRRRPVRILALDPGGAPLSRRRLHSAGSPEYLEAWTDDRGVAVFPTSFAKTRPREHGLYLADSLRHEDNFFAAVDFPAACAERPLPVRQRDGKYPGPAPGEEAGTVVLRWSGTPDAAAPPFPILLSHPDGWFVDRLGEHRLPPGELTLFLGGPFSGWREQAMHLSLRPGETLEPEIAPEPEARLRVRLAAPCGGWLHVQAGEDSTTRALDHDSVERSVVFAVPPAQPLVVLSCCCGETRRARLAPLAPAEEGEIDLREPSCLVQRSLVHDRDAGLVPAARIRFEVVDPEGRELPEARVSLQPLARATGGGGGEEEARPRRFELPAGIAWQARATAPGFLPRWTQGVAPATGAEQTVVLALQPEATLTIHQGENELSLDRFAAGPRSADFELAGGRRLRLRLSLEPGERRRIAVGAAEDGPPPGD